jgi:NitT/TauT family transport system permease protein/taurine transport system permease protein
MMLSRPTFWLSLLAVLILVAAWQLATVYLQAPVGKFPSPADVASRFAEMVASGELATNLGGSLFRLVAGFAIGASLGLAVGIAMTASQAVSGFMQPLVAFFQSIAGVAWIPVAIVWFGIGNGPSLFVTANAVFFIVLFNTIAGVSAVPASQVWAVRVLGGNQLAVFREVLLPGAFVFFLVAIEVGAAFAWRALIFVEIIAGTDGLGFMLNTASTRFDGATIVCLILIIGIVWLVVERVAVRPLRRLTVEKWGVSAAR